MANFDRFNTDEDESFEELEVISICHNPDCKQEISVNDDRLYYYDTVCCHSLKCLIATTDSRLKVAGEDES